MARDLVHEIKGLLPEPVVISIAAQLKISEDLDHEVDTAARTYGYFAVLAERAETRYNKMRFSYETWKATVESQEDQERAADGRKKMTEAERSAYVRTQPKYRSYQLKMIQFNEDMRILKIVAKAFELKKDLVQTKAANRRREAYGKVGKGDVEE